MDVPKGFRLFLPGGKHWWLAPLLVVLLLLGVLLIVSPGAIGPFFHAFF
jgi:hypothetical protein